MLEREQRAAVVQGRVVQRRDVPDGVGADPERQRDEGWVSARTARWPERRGPRAPAPARGRAAPAPTRRGRRSGAGGSRAGSRRRRCPSGVTNDGDDQAAAAEEAGDAPAPVRDRAAHGKQVGGGERDTDERLRVPRPRPGIHGATLVGERGCSSVGRASAFQAECRRFEPGRPLSRARCLAPSGSRACLEAGPAFAHRPLAEKCW